MKRNHCQNHTEPDAPSTSVSLSAHNPRSPILSEDSPRNLPSVNDSPADPAVPADPNEDPTHLPFDALQPPNFTWGSHNGEVFREKIYSAYEEVVHWRRNLFQVPSGSSGKAFVSELARLFQAYADSSSLECIAMKAITVIQIVLLQKPSRTSKSKDHVKHLQRRLDLWLQGDLETLLDEGKCIQNRLGNVTQASSDETVSRIFRDLVIQGKVQSALRYLSRNTSGGVLKLDDLIPETKDGETNMRSTRDILEEKHPKGRDADPRTLVEGDPNHVNPVIFESLDGDAIRQAALHTNGAAGPSGLDALAWRRLCCSFKSASNNLCTALASVGRRIASTYVDPEGLAAFVACRLIPLDKCPGVRPIGVGEVPRRIIAKAILKTIGNEWWRQLDLFNCVQAKKEAARPPYTQCATSSNQLALKLLS